MKNKLDGFGGDLTTNDKTGNAAVAGLSQKTIQVWKYIVPFYCNRICFGKRSLWTGSDMD
jgi:hypothetical protein